MVRSKRSATSSFYHSSERRSKAHSQVDGKLIYSKLHKDTNRNRTCPEVQPWLYGYDAVKEVETAVLQNPEVFAKSTSWGCQIL